MIGDELAARLLFAVLTALLLVFVAVLISDDSE